MLVSAVLDLISRRQLQVVMLAPLIIIYIVCLFRENSSEKNWLGGYEQFVFGGTFLLLVVQMNLHLDIAPHIGAADQVHEMPAIVIDILCAPYNWYWRKWGFRRYYRKHHNNRLPGMPVD